MDSTRNHKRNYFADAIAKGVTAVVQAVTGLVEKEDESRTVLISSYQQNRRKNTGAVIALAAVAVALIIAVTLKKN